MRTRALAAVSLLACAIPACGSARDAEPTGATEERAIADIDARWPSPIIPVCWLPTTITDVDLATKKQSIQTSVSAAYAAAGVTFTGWGDCPASIAGFDGIAITIVDNGQPFSQVGRHKPTQMLLDFSMRNAGDTSARARCSDKRFLGDCLVMAALHEFGHAVALEHEETRTDATQNCGVLGTLRFDDFDVDLGALDPGSIMNHCNPGLYGVPAIQKSLSAGDVAAVSFLFGHASAASPVTLSIGSALFPWYFLNADASGNLQMTPIEGALPATARYAVVPALNGDRTMVSLQSAANASEYACYDALSTHVRLAAGCDSALASWKIDFATNVAPGDSGLRFTLPDGLAMNIGPSPANQIYAALPSSVLNGMEMDFVPRTQVTERLLRSGNDVPSLTNIETGTYLAHVNGAVVLEQLPSGHFDDGNWELVAGLDNPQLVSIRYTDGLGNRFFVQEKYPSVILAPAAAVVAARATFTRTRVLLDPDEIARYRFVEELGGNLELCQQNGALAMCFTSAPLDGNTTFWQMLPFSQIRGVSGDVNVCAEAAAACAAFDQPQYQSLAASCTQLGGVAPPCTFPPCPSGWHFCAPHEKNNACIAGACTPTGFCMVGPQCTYSSTL